MEYVVFPLKGTTVKVAILLDYIVAIWSSEDGTSAYLGMNFDPQEAIEVNVSFEEVMAWFDHYVESGNEEVVNTQKDTTSPRHHKKSVSLIETNN